MQQTNSIVQASTEKVVVRARAPLRLGLAGGGTDLSRYADEYGGAVLNATIDRYAFASVRTSDRDEIVFHASDLGSSETHELQATLPDSRLLLHRGVYERFVAEFNGGSPLPLTITTSVDAPMGSGLGSSSALVVALVEAFRAYLDVPLARYDVAHLAYEIERLDLKLAGGKQDQYAAAFGGINFIEFLPSDRVIVNPLRIGDGIINEIESSLMVCFTGQSRASEKIINLQNEQLRQHDSTALSAMHQIKQDAVDMKAAVLRGEISAIADILERSWKAKRQTSLGVSNARIEELEVLARGFGAIGAKVSGAGGGGFMMFVIPIEKRFNACAALSRAGADAYPVKFTEKGSEVWIPGRSHRI